MIFYCNGFEVAATFALPLFSLLFFFGLILCSFFCYLFLLVDFWILFWLIRINILICKRSRCCEIATPCSGRAATSRGRAKLDFFPLQLPDQVFSHLPSLAPVAPSSQSQTRGMAEIPVVPVPTTPAPSIPSPAQLESPSTTTGNSLLQPLQNLALDPSTAPSLAEASTREEGKAEEQEEDGEEGEEEVEVEPPPLEKTAEQVRIQELEQELADMKAQRDKTKRDFDGVIVKVTKMRDVFTGDLAHERVSPPPFPLSSPPSLSLCPSLGPCKAAH